MSIESTVDVAVVGAGFSGIATTAGLLRYGVRDVALLEAGTQYGEFWAGNYDRIKLHTPWHDLPADSGLSDEYPVFKSKLELLDYLARYASLHGLPAATRFRFNVRAFTLNGVTGEHQWTLVGNKTEDIVHAKYVVVATGYCRVPTTPNIPGMKTYAGTLIHSRSYKNAANFRSKKVLVVGSGNSACEIATDLVESGAAEVALLVFGGRYMIPIERFASFMEDARAQGLAGPPGVRAVHPFTPRSAEFNEQIGANDEALRPLVEDMSGFGIEFPSTGPAYDLIVNNRVPVLDHGAIPLIKNGEIQVIKDRIAEFSESGVELMNQKPRDFDAVIMATGFRPGLEELFDLDVTETREASQLKMPKTDGRCHSTVQQNLYFAGFDHSLWGGLSHGLWGFEIAEKISTELGSFQPGLRPESFGCSPWLTPS